MSKFKALKLSHSTMPFRYFLLLLLAILAYVPPSHAQDTGLLEPCAPGVYGAVPIPGSVLSNISVGYYGSGMMVSKLGLDTPCALQNWSGRDGNDFSYPRGVSAYAFPNEISISSTPQVVTFHVDGAGLGGPFRMPFPECFPKAQPNVGGGCNFDKNYSHIAAREANAGGFFEGRWTLVKNTDLFKFERNTACASAWPDGVLQSPPCSYTLTFATDDNGVPLLQKPVQVAFLVEAKGEPEFSDQFGIWVGPNSTSVIPMLFMPGSSSSVSVQSSSDVVSRGASVILTVKVSGNINPSSLPVVAVESASGHVVSGFVQFAQSTVNTAGEAMFPLVVNEDVSVRARIVGSAAGASVLSDIIDISVVDSTVPPIPTSVATPPVVSPPADAAAAEALLSSLKKLVGEIGKGVAGVSSTFSDTFSLILQTPGLTASQTKALTKVGKAFDKFRAAVDSGVTSKKAKAKKKRLQSAFKASIKSASKSLKAKNKKK